MKKGSGGKMTRRKGGRQFGESTSSGRGLMTKYTRPSGGNSRTMTFKGKPARSNGVKLLKGMSPVVRGKWGQ